MVVVVDEMEKKTQTRPLPDEYISILVPSFQSDASDILRFI